MPILEDKGQSTLAIAPLSAIEQQRRRRMMAALLVLTAALILVLIKDWRVLSPPPPASAEIADSEVVPPPPTDKTIAPPSRVQPATAALAPRKSPIQVHSKQSPEPPVVITTSRAVLPPLEVEVVAGNQRHTVDAGTDSVSVRMQEGLAPPPAAGTAQVADSTVSNATERVQLSPDTAQVLDRRVEPAYPMLAKQMKVQGAVILEALIGKTGDIQDIQVLSGPAILSAAAREAVRQWRFKPHFEAGKPVDTEARITVNFTISTY
jgi:protein TonB